jgi:hypothetical protein
MLDERPVETTLYSLSNSTPEPMQRRRDERHLSLLRVGSLKIGRRRELCLIKNISAGGMLIRPYSRIAEGTRLSIELKQDEPVSGTALWAKDDHVGVGFDSPIDVVRLVATSAGAPRPRMPRVEVDCIAWVREGATVHRARLVNVSQGGVKVLSEGELPAKAEVIVTLAGLPPAPAVVRWRDGKAYGLTFNRALALPLLVGWLQDRQARQARQRSRAAG